MESKPNLEWDTLLPQLPQEEQKAMGMIYQTMPVSDRITYSPALILAYVRQALRAREKVSWGGRIPDAIFYPYVLYYRVNNEDITDCRESFFNLLYPRVKGMTMEQAALEVNLWCLEQATYQATDGRTGSPLAIVKRAFGRCGEESTLAVTAMRSVGIPARQCYTPRWAHCDDNHAWVEVWIDSKWHYIGACEPEPVLDRGWFTAAASRAMLVHSRTFLPSVETAEDVLEHYRAYCTVNNIASYGKTRLAQVEVVSGDMPIKGIQVRFELFNYGELFPLYTGVTDDQGRVSLRAGLGDLYIHAHNGEKFITAKLDANEENPLRLDFSNAVTAGSGAFDFEMNPPAENSGAVPVLDEQVKAGFEARRQRAEALRQQKESNFINEEEAQKYVRSIGVAAEDNQAFIRYLTQSKGNWREILEFCYDPAYTIKDKALILGSLREKDLVDITSEVLRDCLDCAKEYQKYFSEGMYQRYLLSPRVSNEMLRPARKGIRRYFEGQDVFFNSAEEVWRYIQNTLTIKDEEDYPGLLADPLGVLRSGETTSAANGILFVNICRAYGIPARLSPVNGREEYWNGKIFAPVSGISGKPYRTACLKMINESGHPLHYGVNVTIARLENGIYHTLYYHGNLIDRMFQEGVTPGNYRILISSRQIDGSVLIRAMFADLRENQETVIRISQRPDRILEKLKDIPVEDTGLIGKNGDIRLHELLQDGYTVAAFLEPGKEPTEHLLNELQELYQRYQTEQVRILLMVEQGSSLEDKTLQDTATKFEAPVYQYTDRQHLARLHQAMGVGDERLPFVLAIHNRNALYAFANYNVGTAGTLLDIVATERKR